MEIEGKRNKEQMEEIENKMMVNFNAITLIINYM